MNSQSLDQVIIKHLEQRAKSAKDALDVYLSSPTCCRMANDYLIRETVGHASTGDLNLVESPLYIWRCVTCGRCVKDDS